MKFRYARHTNNLKKLEHFYVQIVGLEKLGGFENHNNYNGIFLGKPGLNWHLEFTESAEEAYHQFDEDDVLVFYLNDASEILSLKEKLDAHEIKLITPKNPYWKENGLMVQDPDGYNIVFSILQHSF